MGVTGLAGGASGGEQAAISSRTGKASRSFFMESLSQRQGVARKCGQRLTLPAPKR